MVLEISLLLAAAAAVAAFVLVARIRGWEWTGFRDKTLWDWMQLLVIPLALAAVAFGFDSLQRDRDQRREDRTRG